MTHPAFESLGNRSLPALRLEVQEYRHRVTEARHIHLAADDANNAFLVAFLTVPQDSTGVAHILEHTALCGSRRYPVRDPFFMMTRRSLNTFMNAFTSSDWTAYPFASQNRKDFNNLLDVYLDAAFFPRLHALDFAQEGYRVEFADPAQPDSELVFKGIVFNEMKGAMSSPMQQLGQTLQSLLFPTTTYHYNSGGEPERIPDLSYDQLQTFHARHYHPSNATFLTYGDMPAAEHQARFQDRALAEFQALELDLAIPDETRYRQPQQAEIGYMLDSDDDLRDKTHIVLGWLLGKTTDPRAVMEARLLSDALLDNSSSPLRYALETSNLGTAPSPLCGFDDSTRETTFVCGLEGSNPEQAQALEDLVLGVLSDVAERGIPLEILESVLHQMELSEREITGDGFPYGLRLQLEALTPAIHGGDPVVALNSGPLLDALREEIQDPAFIKQLARRLLLDNAHRVRLVMAPDRTLSAARLAAEKQRLADLKAALDENAKTQLTEQAQALQARQAQEDDPELLPRVGLEDVPEELKIPVGTARPVNDLPTTWYERGTNGMVYQQLVVELPELDDNLIDVLPLFTACVGEVGSGDRDYLTTQALQAAVTGGISARCLVRGEVDDVQQSHGVFILAGKALARNQAALTELLTETFINPRFDELSRLRELIDQLCAQREEDVTQHGHALAILAASAGLSPTAALAHRWDGLLGLQRLRALNETLQQQTALDDFAARLEALRERLKTAPRQMLVVSEEEHQQALADSLARCWEPYPNPAPGSRFRLEPTQVRLQQGWGTSTQVNFCAKAYPSVPQSHPDAPALQVLGDFLRNGYLHRAIREQGGAYGAGAGYHTDSGTFRFYSYRDPRFQETLDDFEHALAWLENAEHSPRAVEEAILGVVAAIDKPGSPAGEAINAFFGDLFSRTAEQRREYRSKILQVSLQDLKRVAATYLQPERASSAVISDVGKVGQLTGWEVATI